MPEIKVAGGRFDAFETLTVSTASVGFTAATRDDRRFALVTCETADVRYRLDGTAPTASVGHVLPAGGGVFLDSPHQVANFRAIRKDSADASLSCSFGY